MQRARSDKAKHERRKLYLAVALDVFFERGFAAARMEDIAKRAGVSKAAIYLYFDSKEALFNALVDAVAVPNVRRLEEMAAMQSATQALRAFLAFAPGVIRDTPLPKIVKVLIADAGVFPGVVIRYRQQVIDRILTAIASILERGRMSGEMKVNDVHLTARLVVAPVIFSAIWRMVFETDAATRLDLNALFAEHENMLFRALSVKLGDD